MPGEKDLLREFVEREFPAEERGVFLRLLEAIDAVRLPLYLRVKTRP